MAMQYQGTKCLQILLLLLWRDEQIFLGILIGARSLNTIIGVWIVQQKLVGKASYEYHYINV